MSEGFVAGSPIYVGNPQSDEQIVVGAAATGLSPDPMSNGALIQVLGANVRALFAGGTPTAANGFQLVPGDMIRLTGRASLLAFQVIREGAADATLQVAYEFLEEKTPDEIGRISGRLGTGTGPAES